MSAIARDDNRVKVAAGLLDTDGATITMVKADPTTHIIYTDDNTTGTDNGGMLAAHDENHMTTLTAVSSADGTTPVPLYVDSSGRLLIDSA